MRRALLLPALALLGVGITAVTVTYGNRPVTAGGPSIQLPEVPYTSYVAGAGIVEASSGNIAIGSPVAGVVGVLYVKVGDRVKTGAPLFMIDDRDLQAQLLTANAKVQEAAAALRGPRHRLDYAEHLKGHDPNAISDQALSDLRDTVALAQASLSLAQAQVAALRIEIARYTVRAPVTGEVLQLRMRLGEYLDGGTTATPLLLFGATDRFNLRVDIDEQDAWRVRRSAAAVAFVRGNPALKVPLRFEYIEPYVIPKTSLTGSGTERTDTRVLQVIYSFARGVVPVHVGQQMDAYIQAPPLSAVVSGNGPDH